MRSNDTRFYARKILRVCPWITAIAGAASVGLPLTGVGPHGIPFRVIQIGIGAVWTTASLWLALSGLPPLVRLTGSTMSWRPWGSLRWRKIARSEVAGVRFRDSLDPRLVNRAGAECRFPLLQIERRNQAHLLSLLSILS